MSSWNKPRLAAVLATTLGGWLLAAATPRDFIAGTFSDDAQYAVLAKALRERHVYRSIQIPGEPPEIKYPPGWPAVLALAWRPGASGLANLQRLKTVNLVIVGPLAGALALAAMAVFGLGPFTAAAAALAGVASAAVVPWWTIPMSEPLCLALLALGLVLAAGERWRGAAVTLALAVWVRSLAAPFLLGLLIVAVRRLGWRRALARVTLGAGLLLPWAAWVLSAGRHMPAVLTTAAHGSYGAWYLESLAADPVTVLVTVPLKNVPLLVEAIGLALPGWRWASRPVLMGVGLLLIFLVSRAAWRNAAFGVGLLLYVVLVVMWPFPGADRFVGSVWPLLLFAALAALPGTGDRGPGSGVRGVGRWMRPAILIVAVVGAGITSIAELGVLRHRQRSAAALALADSLRPRIPRGAVVGSTNPALWYLLLDTPTVPVWSYRTYRWYRTGGWLTAWGLGDDLWPIIRRYRPGYIMVERRGAEGRYAAGSIMRQCPGALTLLWESRAAELLLAVDPAVPCTPERNAR